MKFQGVLYRAIRPAYAATPLSAKGAALNGGRFNSAGRRALYTADNYNLAILEYNQSSLMNPLFLVGYEVDLGNVLDTADPAQLLQFGTNLNALLLCPWRFQAQHSPKTKTFSHAMSQLFARRVESAGYDAMRVSSQFSQGGAIVPGYNYVLFRSTLKSGKAVKLHDPANFLGGVVSDCTACGKKVFA